MKKIVIVIVALALLCSGLAGCTQATAEAVNTPEVMREKFFDSFYEMLDRTAEVVGDEVGDDIKSRIQQYEAEDFIQNPDDEHEYYFECDSGFLTEHESTVYMWTDQDGEVKAMGITAVDNEGYPALRAVVGTFLPDVDVGDIQEEVFDFINSYTVNTEMEYNGVVITKAFNNEQNIVTGDIDLCAVYSVYDADAGDEFKAYLEERVDNLKTKILS